MKRLLLIALMGLIMLAVMPASAQYITMSNPGSLSERDILVYNASGSLVGVFNSTSTIPLNGSQDYLFQMKPVAADPLSDPGSWAISTLALVRDNATGILVLMLIIIATLAFLGRK